MRDQAAASRVASRRTGEILVDQGALTALQLDLCLRAQVDLRHVGVQAKIGEIVLMYGFASRAEVEAAIAETGEATDGLDIQSFPAQILRRLRAVPITFSDGVLHVAAAGTLDDADKADLIAVATDKGLAVRAVEVVPRDRMEVLRTINGFVSPNSATVSAELAELTDHTDDSVFISQVIEHIYIDALQARASDIHISVSESPEFSWIAHRIDGSLRYTHMVSPKAMAVVATRIKSDAGIDFSDTMRPHDGRTSVRYNGKQVDIRVSTLPIDEGESIVMRLLDHSNIPSIARIFEIHTPVAQGLEHIISADQKSGGMLLVTGATGSGKSTTLNAVLRSMDRSRRSVKTVEDPVELRVPLVGHTQVNEASGLSYSKVLRAILRQDPDIIMVGELRDADTVETALRAAETGHLLLSTLHTGSVAESVTRLLGMMDAEFRGIGKYIVSDVLKGVVNQKLVRRLCTKCMALHVPDQRYVDLLASVIGSKNLPSRFYAAAGCERCEHTGYFGRAVIPEALFIGQDHETRAQLEAVLIEGRAFREVLTLPNVVWYSKEQAIGRALEAGHLDIGTALVLLEIHSRGDA